MSFRIPRDFRQIPQNIHRKAEKGKIYWGETES